MYENPTSLKQAPFDPMIPETYPVSVDDLGRYVAENHFNENNKFKEQFKVCDSLNLLLLLFYLSYRHFILVTKRVAIMVKERSLSFSTDSKTSLSVSLYVYCTLIVHTYGVESNDSLFTGP